TSRLAASVSCRRLNWILAEIVTDCACAAVTTSSAKITLKVTSVEKMLSDTHFQHRDAYIVPGDRDESVVIQKTICT
ncbi:MAG: hypothetical protein OEO83_20080, partial [Alphaproteobacteria bacterium]|nr:hypothetical protein [Alphaproteobacteria bacterium]